jgi:hypothetical protein
VQILSLTWGILAVIGMFIGLIPCIGALNWLNIPFAVVGLVVSLVSHSSHPGPNKTGSLIGIILCVLAVVIGFKRLVLGGGIL